MHFEQPHQLGQQQAIQRLDSTLSDLMTRTPPAGLDITDPQKTWAGNRMNFSFKAAKGFFGAHIHGSMEVTDNAVIVDAELPTMLTRFMGEDRIIEMLSQQIANVLRP